jgi:hypothetical protein
MQGEGYTAEAVGLGQTPEMPEVSDETHAEEGGGGFYGEASGSIAIADGYL